jgi:gliding motility-associated-like protein
MKLTRNKLAQYLTIFFLISVTTVNAQLCTGSLGDPVINIDFGSGTSTRGPELVAGITSYPYTTGTFHNIGTYTIANSTADAGSQWWSTTDHTGNSGGYMMVVNASYSITDYFYKNTITGLCSSTTYEFAAWVMNMLNSIDVSPPNITFTIETTTGSILNSYNTGTIPIYSSPTWKQYGFYFTTPANVSTVVIRMRNNSAGGSPGNDIALDDITFRPCGPTLAAYFAGASAMTNTYSICEGAVDYVQLHGTTSSGYSNPQYQWQLFSGNKWQDIVGASSLDASIIISALPAGTYRYRFIAGENTNFSYSQCRVISNIITLTVNALPKVTATGDTICSGSTATISAKGATTYSWNYGLGTGQVKNVSTKVTNTYTVTGTDQNGCSNKADAQVTVYDLPKVSATGDTICFGATANITASGAQTFSWSNDLGTGSTKSVSPGITTTYTVTGTDLNSCSNTALAIVKVNQLPVITLSSDTICIGSTATIRVSGANSYTWSDGLGSGPIKTVNPLTNTVYTVTGTDLNGCKNSAQLEVVVDALPVAGYFIDSLLVCEQKPVHFIDISKSDYPLLYYWTFGDGGTSTEQNPFHVYNQTGTYKTTLMVTTNHGCKDTSTLDANITLMGIPKAAFSVNPIETSFFDPQISFTDRSTDAESCSIDWGDGTITDCSITDHTFLKAGHFKISETVINAAGCDNTTSTTIYIRPEYRFFVPNAFTPNEDNQNEIFKPSLIGVHNYSLMIFDRWGEKLFETSDSEIGWNGRKNGELCPGGVFVYKINFIDDVNEEYHQFVGSVTIVK